MERLIHTFPKCSKTETRAASLLQHLHIFSNITTEITSWKRQQRLLSNEAIQWAMTILPHENYCSSLALLHLPGFIKVSARACKQLLHSCTYFKEKTNHCLHKSHVCLESSAFLTSPGWNASCSSELTLYTNFLPEILRAQGWYALTSCLFLRPLVSHPRQKKSSLTRSARQILWDWGLFHHIPSGVCNLFHTGIPHLRGNTYLHDFKACFVIIQITKPVFTCLVRSSMHNAPPPRTYLETDMKENIFDINSW